MARESASAVGSQWRKGEDRDEEDIAIKVNVLAVSSKVYSSAWTNGWEGLSVYAGRDRPYRNAC